MTETDRELLMFAAKAAGLTPDIGVYIKTGHMLVKSESAEQPFFWNPLTDDGDAFRLAVKLNLFQEPAFTLYELIPASIEQDALVATRRAIVRAAAEIGRNMK
jgi:hypothetical protein